MTLSIYLILEGAKNPGVYSTSLTEMSTINRKTILLGSKETAGE
jgi:hypothetical protein